MGQCLAGLPPFLFQFVTLLQITEGSHIILTLL